MKVVLYARVSKALDQNPENQLIELRRWASATQHIVLGEFVDEVSSKDTRPEKEKVLRMIRLGEVQGVAFWSLDRWGRSMSELVLELEEFSKAGISMFSMKEGLDLSTSAGRLMANILSSMANFERDRIKERTLLGLARYKAQGGKLGRPKKIKTSLFVNNETGERSEIVVGKTPPENPTTFLEEIKQADKTDVFQESQKEEKGGLN